ncbi:biotin/lipoyl-binding carrier protein [Natronoglycomyces albus]|uniref:Biotin/lipoyl-binding carrier protein n=1 Tax=Natronoglycomyces albus TaxID=2811108 RepID=A0A895XN31_9ACTN|nr:biotin/lipoyl-binding carrier protein [Natronoglycomyces albus]
MAEEVRAEIPANVLRIEVEVGQEVKAGQTLVLLESMKMEIPAVPEEPGRVARIAVAAGDVIQEGDLIAVLE